MTATMMMAMMQMQAIRSGNEQYNINLVTKTAQTPKKNKKNYNN